LKGQDLFAWENAQLQKNHVNNTPQFTVERSDMKKNVSSRKKPGKKVSSPDQSTSSSIIEVGNQEEEIKLLNWNEKKIILETMYRGGSPVWVCKDLGVNFSRYLKSFNEDTNFRELVENAKAALSENIAFQLFKTAMEGNVTAQTNFLKLFPPLSWSSGNQTGGSIPGSDEWIDKMSDKELFQLAKEMDIHVPEEFIDGSPDS
jgi:hypothetical protein